MKEWCCEVVFSRGRIDVRGMVALHIRFFDQFPVFSLLASGSWSRIKACSLLSS